MYHLYVFIVKGSLSLDESKALFKFGATHKKQKENTTYLAFHCLQFSYWISYFHFSHVMFLSFVNIPKNEVKSAIQPRIAKMAKISAYEQFLIVGYYTLPT